MLDQALRIRISTIVADGIAALKLVMSLFLLAAVISDPWNV